MRNEINMIDKINVKKAHTNMLDRTEKKCQCFYCELYKNECNTVMSVEMSLLLALLPLLILLPLPPLLAVVVIVLLPSLVVSFEAFIKLIVGIVGRLAKTAGGGGNALVG